MENNTNVGNLYQSEKLEWVGYIFLCFMLLVAIIGIPGNGIVLAVLIKLKDKGSTDILVLTMCLTDLFSSTINSLLYIFRYQPSIWIVMASTELCRLHMLLICVTLITTTLLLAATAHDRLKKTKSNSTRDTFTTIRKSKLICVGIISFGSIYGIIYMFTITLDSTSLQCVHITKYRIMATTLSCILALLFIFMFGVVIVCYTNITIILRRHNLQIFQTKRTTVNLPPMSNHKFWNRNTKIQPLCQEMNMPSTSNGILLSADSINGNELVGIRSKSSMLQNRTKTYNKNRGPLMISTITHGNDYDSKSSETLDNEQNGAKTQENVESSKSKQKLNIRTNAIVERNRKKINTTTLMMFLITLIYITTWVINWSTKIFKVATNTRSLKTDFLTERLYMILCVTNPLFYMFMSSKFRIKAKEMFCK